jgi:hypothetical protein
MQDLARHAAANDTQYLPPRHRTLPILASVTPIANYPAKLRIFLTNASRYWQVRCFLKGRTYTQSLTTTQKQAAISQAKQFFHIKTAELYADRVEARSDRKVKFADLIPGVVVGLQARVKRGEFAAANIPIFLNRMHNSILPYFGDMTMDQIGYRQLTDFMEKMSNRDLSATTVHQHMVAIRKVFAHAHGTQLSSEGHDYPLLDELVAESPLSIKSQAPKPKNIKPIKPPSPEQMRINQLKANVDRQKDALQRERENQKRQRDAEQARRAQGGY